MTKLNTSRLASKSKKTKKLTIPKLALQTLNASVARIDALLEGIRFAAVHEPDEKYRKPILLLAPNATAFGEAENVLAAYFAAAKSTKVTTQVYDFTTTLGHLTMTEIADLFFHKTEEMKYALTIIAGTFALAQYGYSTTEMHEAAAEQLTKLFDLLGVKKKS